MIRMSSASDPPTRVERTVYPDGAPKEEITYQGSAQHGPWRKWHPNGQLASEYWLDRGVYTNCTNRSWHPNGTLESEQVFVNERVVLCRVYSERGRLIFSTTPEDQRKTLCRRIERAKAAKPRRAKKDPEAAARTEAFARERLQSRAAEARGWFNNSPDKGLRTLGELSPEVSLDLVNALYELGALAVTAVEIEDIPGTSEQTTNHLIVQLPVDPAARARLFAFERAVAREGGFDPEPDCGQAYVYLKLC